MLKLRPFQKYSELLECYSYKVDLGSVLPCRCQLISSAFTIPPLCAVPYASCCGFNTATMWGMLLEARHAVQQ